jgi:hypothetical protein
MKRLKAADFTCYSDPLDQNEMTNFSNIGGKNVDLWPI